MQDEAVVICWLMQRMLGCIDRHQLHQMRVSSQVGWLLMMCEHAHGQRIFQRAKRITLLESGEVAGVGSGLSIPVVFHWVSLQPGLLLPMDQEA